MPESMSIERRRMMAVLGAELILTEAAKGMPGAIAKAKEIADSDPAKYFMPGQFENPANPEIHFKTTGPEIWNDCDGAIDILVAGVGTGGTITGVSRYIKNEAGKAIESVAVEPSHSPVITQTLNGEPLKPGLIQGIGYGFIPKNLDMSVVDQVEQVANDESVEMALRLAKEEGLLVGISCGAAAACDSPRRRMYRRPTIVVVLPGLAGVISPPSCSPMCPPESSNSPWPSDRRSSSVHSEPRPQGRAFLWNHLLGIEWFGVEAPPPGQSTWHRHRRRSVDAGNRLGIQSQQFPADQGTHQKQQGTFGQVKIREQALHRQSDSPAESPGSRAQ